MDEEEDAEIREGHKNREKGKKKIIQRFQSIMVESFEKESPQIPSLPRKTHFWGSSSVQSIWF